MLTGIQISYHVQIGESLYVGHFGAIVVSDMAVIGRNVNLSPCICLGKGNRGPNKGYPRVGNNVYIAPGAKLIGNVKVGDNVSIGANAVVTHDVPDNACVVGVPVRVVSMQGAEEYVNNLV